MNSLKKKLILTIISAVLLIGCDRPDIPGGNGNNGGCPEKPIKYSFFAGISKDGVAEGKITEGSTANGTYDRGTKIEVYQNTIFGFFYGWYDAESGGYPITRLSYLKFDLQQDTAVYARYLRKEANIPDPALEKAIRQAINITAPKLMYYHLNEKVGLQYIGNGKPRIANLTGIEYMTALSTLILEQNELQDISLLKELIELKSLNLSKNWIRDITPLCRLTRLSNLKLANNEITDIKALENLSALKYLYLSNNKIKTIEVLANAENLIELDLSNNMITSIEPLLNNPHLGPGSKVILSGNNIETTKIEQLRAKEVEVIF